MFWTAALALVFNLLCHFGLGGSGLPLAPELLGLTSLVAWLLGGARGALVVLPAAWACLAAGWVIDNRLTPALAGQDIVVEGTVCSVPKNSGRAVRFMLRTHSVDPLVDLPRNIYIGWYDSDLTPVPGDTWRLRVRLRRPRGTANPGAFDFERWAYIRAIGATGYVRESTLNRRLVDSGACALTTARFNVASRIAGVLEGRAAMPFVVALAVGMRDRLAAGERDLLRDSGTAHLLAISGLHIGLVAGLTLVLGGWFARLLLLFHVPCRPFFLSRIAALLAALGYAAMAGFAVPTVRALVMLTIVLSLSCARRAWTGLSVLGAALYLVLWIEPAAPVTTGFWLSFVAVGVLMLQALACRAERPARLVGLRAAIPAQLVIAIGLAPLGMLVFERVSWVAPAVNLVFIPLFAFLVVPLVLGGTLLLLISDRLGGWLLGGAESIIAQLLGLLGRVMTHVEGVWHAPVMSWPLTALWCLSALIAVWPRPLPGRTGLIAVLLVLLMAGYYSRASPALQIVVMDVGQGLAVLVRHPKYSLLYDTGPDYGVRDAGESVIVPVLRQLGVKRLDAIIVSHFDTDHSGGLASVVEHFPATVIANPSRNQTVDPGIDLSPCAAPASWAVDELSFRIVSPGHSIQRRLKTDNDLSCVVIVEFRGFRLLLPGDIERVAESLLVAGAELSPADILIAPHHGSKTSSSVKFVESVAAKFVIYSVGHRNRWGFPSSEVVDRWRSVSDCQLSTAESGAIIIEFGEDGAHPELRRQRATSGRIWNEPPIDRLPCGADATN